MAASFSLPSLCSLKILLIFMAVSISDARVGPAMVTILDDGEASRMITIVGKPEGFRSMAFQVLTKGRFPPSGPSHKSHDMPNKKGHDIPNWKGHEIPFYTRPPRRSKL
ncbi:hypothetical protein NE237_031249 [Protea cynaroides]|uniref:Uncharacterized protein n=1 Tax=Protea cynaroides TaxID=273540 RepID=A0A9Q0R2B6_9MAGN|nr:hypothetical protein NE237_031249 [Protea cynaroides]